MTSPLLKCNDKRPDGKGWIATVTEEELCHAQLVKVVEWLEEHNPCRHHRDNEPEALSNKSLYLTPEDWQSLKELAK